MNGFIHSIESLATFEGKGLRAAVFMQGCPLRCVYCHNPDTWEINQGEVFTPEQLVKRLSRFKPYFKNGGGVTFSGGEPLLQADFLLETADLLKTEGIGFGLDTSCAIFTEGVKELYRKAEFVLADLKFAKKEDYIKYCKADVFDTVLRSLSYLAEINKPVILRTVIVPKLNENDKSAYETLASRFPNVEKHDFLPFHTMGFSKYERLGIENPLAKNFK